MSTVIDYKSSARVWVLIADARPTGANGTPGFGSTGLLVLNANDKESSRSL
jgi:hypothetical protein